MERFVVIATPTASNRERFENHRIQNEVDRTGAAVPVPAGYSVLFGPAGLDECTAFLIKTTAEKAPGWFWLSVAQYALIALVTITFVGVIVIGALKLQAFGPAEAIKGATALDDGARVLITFLVAVSTVAIGDPDGHGR